MIVEGVLRQRSFETKDGEKRTVVELDVDEIGASLRYATVRINRTTADGNRRDDRRRAAAVTTARHGREAQAGNGFHPAGRRRCRPAGDDDF